MARNTADVCMESELNNSPSLLEPISFAGWVYGVGTEA